MSTHTPGPWIADTWYVGPKALPTLVKVNPNGPVAHEEIIANARLIAAAPDLLAALQGIMAGVAGCQKEPQYEAARAAISQAQQGQQTNKV